MANQSLKQALGEKLLENVVLRDFTLIRTGGPADFFFEANSVNELVLAVRAASSLNIPYFILGEGSSILISDFGFPGLVIKNNSSNISFLEEEAQVLVDSGVLLKRLILAAAEKELGGLENLAGIKGTVGGAIFKNLNQEGLNFNDFLKLVVFLTPEGKVESYEKDWPKEKAVILTTKLQLIHNKKEEILRKINQFNKMSQNSRPNDLSLGPVFRDSADLDQIFKKSKVGSLKVNEAYFSKQYPNFLVNRRNSTSSDIRLLIEKAKEKVKETAGVFLEEQIEYIGQW